MDIVFAVLPFWGLEYPALGVSLLKAHADRLGFRTCVRYFNFDLAEKMGYSLYRDIGIGFPGGPVETANRMPTEAVVGEWFFADEIFAGRIPPEGDYVERFLAADPGRREFAARIRDARAHAGPLVESCAQEIHALRPRIVGFTSTFDQTCACLAVARRLKELPGPPVILFGGANCEGEMGQQLIRSFPWIDYISTGEADESFPAFLRDCVRGGRAEPPAGILARGGAFTVPEPVHDLDALPLPDFSDYFERESRSPLARQIQPALQPETSRGCWWGARQHCTFCGLNGKTMQYRAKSPGRALAEIETLTRTYGVKRVECVDNILDMRYFESFLPALIRKDLGLDMYYETKANLRHDQLQLMRDAGVRRIVPGIESFSNQVLRLIRKGSTGLQNIQLLKWCAEVGITPKWNLLWGVPGESPAEYRTMTELVPLLVHLPPPFYCIPIRLDRFSPYFNQPESFGISNVRPAAAYTHIFPLSLPELRKMAYFFEYDYPEGFDPHAYAAPLLAETRRWSDLSVLPEEADRPRLDSYQNGELVYIFDTRPCASAPLHVLGGIDAGIALACDRAHTAEALRRMLGESDAAIRESLARLRESRLMTEMDGQFLSLPVLRNRSATGMRPAAQPETTGQLVHLG